MKGRRNMSRLVAIVSVLMMTVSGLAEFPLAGAQGRAGAQDASATGFPSHKDIDDPNPAALPYAPTNTSVSATVRNTGQSAIASQFPVSMEVGKGTPETRFYEDAEGPWMPSDWSVTDFTGPKWHVTNKSFVSPSTSAWCGLEGQAAIQYGANWAEYMCLTNPVTVPSASTPYLQFSHYYDTKFNTDGGYLEIRNMSISPEKWERNTTGNWSFTSMGYNGNTSSINPAQTNDTWSFSGSSGGWLPANVNLAHYAGYQIKVRFIFSSSQNNNPVTLYGWFIDDVKITDSVTTPFQDAFDSMANWTCANMKSGGGVTPGWRRDNGGNPNNATGTKCFSNNNPLNNAYSDGEDSALVTPSISLAGATNARLYFWQQNRTQALNDGGFIEVQVAGGDWIPLQSPWLTDWLQGKLDPRSPYGDRNAYSGDSIPPAPRWYRPVFDLSQYVGNNIRIRFHFFSNEDGNTGFGWYLDEITVVAWNFTMSGSAQRNAPPLNPAQTATLTFNFDLSGGEGIYRFKLITNLPGDEDTSNDAYTIIIEVKKNLTIDLGFAQNPVSIIHGRTDNITVRVTNTGNMPNDVTLGLVSYPPSWNVSLNRSNISAIKELTTANTTMRVSVPVNEYSNLFFITVNVTSRLNSTIKKERTLQVQVINSPPTASQKPPSPNPARVFELVFFDGSASSDADGDPLNYSWVFGDGTGPAYGQKPSHIFEVKGIYNVTLNVTDGSPGSFSTAQSQVQVDDGSPIPVIRIITTPYNGTYQINSPVEFSGSGSGDEQISSLTFEWDFGDETEAESGMVVFHNFTSRGKFNVTLTVTDKGGQSNVSDPKQVTINDYPVAVISSPLEGAIYYTGDALRFESNGSSDPDGDPLTFEWYDNQVGADVISTSASFTRVFDVGGLTHIITLNVYDGHGKLSYNYTQRKIFIDNRTNHPPRLENGTVNPKEGDQGWIFNYTVRYFDEDNDPPSYLSILIDRNAPQSMLLTPSDPMDNNFRDGKDYYFVPLGTLLRGQDSPHNFSFETADKKSGRVATDSQDGPVVKWKMPIGKDSWMPETVTGSVYLIGNFRTLLSGVDVTPPQAPANNESLGLAFLMNTTAPADKWFWANITIKYNNLNYSSLCESSLQVYWSVDDQPWTRVPNSSLNMADHFLWLNVTRPDAKYAVFGTPLPEPPRPHPPEKPVDYTMAFAGAGAAAVAVVGIGLFLLIRKKRAAPPEPARDSRVEEPVGETVSGEAFPPAQVEKAGKVVAVGGESVKTFQPGGSGGVAIFRPGEGHKTKVFRPGGVEEPVVATPSTEAEEKIFKPEVRDVEDGETAEGPIVEEEAVKEKVVEYTDEKALESEQTPQMPGARPAEEEIEEVEGKKPITKPPEPKKDEDSLDNLMKELDK